MLDKTVEVDIRADGTVRESTHLEVRLDSERDLEVWSPYGIVLDENRTLESLAASVRRSGGASIRVSRRDLDTSVAAPGWILHSSQTMRTIRFPPSPPGSVLVLDWTTLERPYFPSGLLRFGERDQVLRLSVTVRAATPLRWRLFSPAAGVEEEAIATGVRFTGAVPSEEAPAHALTGAANGPTLRYAWGPSDTWTGVGQWYERLAAELPRNDSSVRQQALALVATIKEPRAKLEALLGFARQQVRYVAVEVGVGGYLAAAPAETLTRRWGDCKAKALLLIDLLRAAGITAHPTLILSDAEGRISDFSSPDEFNHLIVAVEAAGLAAASDATAQGLLFVDPTHPYASPGWLPTSVQDQDALVVRGEDSHLVRTPTTAAHERADLAVGLEIGKHGSQAGRALLHLEGEVAAQLEERLAAADQAQAEQAAIDQLLALLPGAVVTNASASTGRDPSGVPTAVVTAEITLPGLATLQSGAADAKAGLALALPGPEATPSSSLLDQRTVPVVLEPGITGITFRLTVPANWSLPASEETGEENAVGSFQQSVSTDGATVVLSRRTELRQRIVEPADFSALRALALAERRAARKWLRFGVSEGR